MIKNVIANFLPGLWNSLSIFMLLPIYVKLLGVDGYGVLAIYGVLLGTIAFVDAGLTATVTREMAASLVTKRNEASVIVTLERIYIVILCLVAGLSFLIEDWFVKSQLEGVHNASSIYFLMVASALVAMLSAFYIGAIIGRERQILANGILIKINVLKAILGIICIYIFKEKLIAFFISQLILSVLSAYGIRFILINKVLNSTGDGKFLLPILKNNLKFTGGLFLISLISSINTQADKIFVNNIEGLVFFAGYAASAAIAQLPLLISASIGRAFYPKIVFFVEKSECSNLFKISISSTRLYVFLSCIILYVLYFLGEEILALWLQDEALIEKVLVFFPLLFLSNMGIGVQVFVFNLALAFKITRLNVYLGTGNALLILLLIPHLLRVYGVESMLLSLILINWGIFIVYSLWVFNTLNILDYKSWIFRSLLVPIGIILLVSSVTSGLTQLLPGYFVLKLFIVIVMVGISTIYLSYMCGGLSRLFLFSKSEFV